MPAKWLTELVERDLKKGTRYWGVEGRLWSEENPDAYAGVHNCDGVLVIFDEASGIADAIWAVTAGFFTENTPNRFWLAFSNPRRNSGYFYETFHSKREFWGTKVVDARTVEGTDKQVYQQIIDEYGPDSSQAHVEVYGEFPNVGDDQFISNMVVDDAMKRPQYKDPSAPIVIGVDPARFGADATVIAIRQGRDIPRIIRHRGDDTMTVVGYIIEAIEEYKPAMVFIDEGGLGAGVVDRLKEQRYKIKGVNFGWKSANPAMYGQPSHGQVLENRSNFAYDEARLKGGDLFRVEKRHESAGGGISRRCGRYCANICVPRSLTGVQFSNHNALGQHGPQCISILDGIIMATKPGLYANINAKQARIKAGSGEKMNKVGSKAAPTAKDFKDSAKTAKPVKKK
jgi:hypothetical protein